MKRFLLRFLGNWAPLWLCKELGVLCTVESHTLLGMESGQVKYVYLGRMPQDNNTYLVTLSDNPMVSSGEVHVKYFVLNRFGLWYVE